jgi:hypothetical protein
MLETRIAPSVDVMKAAKIDYGAALDFPDAVRIPDQFTLIMPRID